MKSVLIIDASPMFREFLKEKLSAENIMVETASGHRDAYIKLTSLLPDLIILDILESVYDMMDFLEKKKNDPNAVRIPTIISGPYIEREEVASLVPFGVVKYFTKPIKFDVFFESIGKILRATFSMDTTPCVLELHLNKNIIFVEIAQGMNREKLSLLKYKLSELMDHNRLDKPKVLIMMTDLSLSFVDGSNLELLLDNVLADRRIEPKNVKILSLDSFTKELIDGHPEYSGVEVCTNLSQVLNSVVEAEPTASLQDLISDQILSSTGNEEEGSVEMRFHSDTSSSDDSDGDGGSIMNIAIVDDDPVVRQQLDNTFKSIGAEVTLFANGDSFLQSLDTRQFNIVILDLFMPGGLSGLDVLRILKEKGSRIPVLVYSQATQREAVIQSLSLGAKGYLTKPQKPEVLLKKAVDILNG